MPLKVTPSSIPNPYISTREPELFQQLTGSRCRVFDTQLDRLAAAQLHDAAFRLQESPHPMEDVKATEQVLRVLTRDSWDSTDPEIFDACWQQAAFSDLFADKFES